MTIWIFSGPPRGGHSSSRVVAWRFREVRRSVTMARMKNESSQCPVVEWSANHQRLRVELRPDCARFLVRGEEGWELIQEAPLLGAGTKYDLSKAHREFREQVRSIQAMMREDAQAAAEGRPNKYLLPFEDDTPPIGKAIERARELAARRRH